MFIIIDCADTLFFVLESSWTSSLSSKLAALILAVNSVPGTVSLYWKEMFPINISRKLVCLEHHYKDSGEYLRGSELAEHNQSCSVP